MPKVVYLQPDGTTRVIDGITGDSVMRTAKLNGVDGIVAECGGNCSCASCHVYVGADWSSTVGPPGPLEDDMLEDTASERRATSRLSCQIALTAELDGLLVEIAPEQL